MLQNDIEFNVEEQRERGTPKKILIEQVEEEHLKTDLNLLNACSRTNWR